MMVLLIDVQQRLWYRVCAVLIQGWLVARLVILKNSGTTASGDARLALYRGYCARG